MIFTETKLKGAYIIDLRKIEDQRGFFARAWCQQEFQDHGLNIIHAQTNIGFSERKGTIRGIHYPAAPLNETKLVRCTRGAIFDVIVDLRPESPTHRQWFALELSAENHRMLHIPEGCAHGYQTLSDKSEICYQTSLLYVPDSGRGVRWNDPAFGIQWPLEVQAISDVDRAWPEYSVT